MKRQYWRQAELGFALAVLPLLTVGAIAQIAVSANDNKAVLVDGVNVVPDNPAADTVSIIDLGAMPPKVIGEVKRLGQRRWSASECCDIARRKLCVGDWSVQS